MEDAADSASSASDVPPDMLLKTLDSLGQSRVKQMHLEGINIDHINEWKVRKAGEEWRVECCLCAKKGVQLSWKAAPPTRPGRTFWGVERLTEHVERNEKHKSSLMEVRGCCMTCHG